MSFFQRSRSKEETTPNSPLVVKVADTNDTVIHDVDVDVFETRESIVVFAQAAGADIQDVHIAIEGEADIVIIEGHQTRPEYLVFPEGVPDGIFYAKECAWGEFYRRIILPEQIDIKNAEAKIKSGVLILVLPLQHSHQNRPTASHFEDEVEVSKKSRSA